MKRAWLLTSVLLLFFCALQLNANAQQEKILKWAFDADMNTIDPHAQAMDFELNVMQHITEPLVRRNNELQLEPALATSWKVLDPAKDPTLWRFTLRQGVKFHNGNPFNADDVVASLKRAIHPSSSVKGNCRGVVDAKKVDDYTVDIITDGPYPVLPKDLVNIFMMDKEWMTEHNCLLPADPAKGETSYAFTNMMGTGPFEFVSWEKGQKLTLKTNSNWWDKVPNFQGIEIIPIASNATRMAALLSGEINFDQVVPVQDVERVKTTKGVKLLQGVETREVALMLFFGDALNESNLKGKNPFKDIRIRQAVYQSIDMDTMREKIMRGLSKNTGSFIHTLVPGYEPSMEPRSFPYDPDSAKKLLAAGGYPDGFEFGLDVGPEGEMPNIQQIAEALAGMWAKVGLKVKITQHPNGASTFKKIFVDHKSDAWFGGWACNPSVDPAFLFLEVFSMPFGSHGFLNGTLYNNSTVADYAKRIMSEMDEPTRLKFIREGLKVAKDDIAMIPLHFSPILWATSDKVHITLTADNKPRVWTASID